MKADATQQRSLLELAALDAELTRIAHRVANLAEHQRCAQLEADHRAANDRVAVLRIAIEDLDGQIGRLEDQVDSVRRREDRDRGLLDAPTTNAKQLAELQHELETLQRRQASLEDSMLEVMERREQLQQERDAEQTAIDALNDDLAAVSRQRDAALADIDRTRLERMARREQLTAAIDPELASLYERVGAGALQQRRCGACRIEIDRGELSRFAAAADDEVLRCPECGAILLRDMGFGT
jgi:predicted  nucleic acid-binding Zn-ribbon protein